MLVFSNMLWMIKTVMHKKSLISILLVFLTCSFCFGQSQDLLLSPTAASGDSITFIQIRTDTLFHSKQIMSLLVLPKMELVTDRNPRTCLCETKESLVFITIDGRSGYSVLIDPSYPH
jgi:hypothetical protein